MRNKLDRATMPIFYSYSYNQNSNSVKQNFLNKSICPLKYGQICY